MAKSHFTRIVLLLLLVFSVESKASFLDEVDSFFGAGACFQKAPPHKLWNQRDSGFETNEDNTDACFRFGVEYGWLRIAYFDLGAYRADNMASNDEECVEQNGKNGSKVCGYHNRFITTGSTRGISIGTEFAHKGYFLEAAITGVRTSFALQVSNNMAPYNVLTDLYSGTRYGTGWMLGVGYNKKDVSVGVWAYDDSNANKFHYPAGRHITFVCGLEVSF